MSEIATILTNYGASAPPNIQKVVDLALNYGKGAPPAALDQINRNVYSMYAGTANAAIVMPLALAVEIIHTAQPNKYTKLPRGNDAGGMAAMIAAATQTQDSWGSSQQTNNGWGNDSGWGNNAGSSGNDWGSDSSWGNDGADDWGNDTSWGNDNGKSAFDYSEDPKPDADTQGDWGNAPERDAPRVSKPRELVSTLADLVARGPHMDIIPCAIHAEYDNTIDIYKRINLLHTLELPSTVKPNLVTPVKQIDVSQEVLDVFSKGPAMIRMVMIDHDSKVKRDVMKAIIATNTKINKLINTLFELAGLNITVDDGYLELEGIRSSIGDTHPDLVRAIERMVGKVVVGEGIKTWVTNYTLAELCLLPAAVPMYLDKIVHYNIIRRYMDEGSVSKESDGTAPTVSEIDWDEITSSSEGDLKFIDCLDSKLMAYKADNRWVVKYIDI